jgi:hypothetical protein
MRYLKQKIARALQHHNGVLQESPKEEIVPQLEEQSVSTSNEFEETKIDITSPNSHTKGSTSGKNIVKNYSRAMINFALSKLAAPYLPQLLVQEKIKMEEFRRFLNLRKTKVNCIKSMRELLLIAKEDTMQVAACKNIFKEICKVFIKYFSVNWIFSSKISDRIVHLKYRFKLLRRIQDPEHFTYLESFSRK